MYQRKSVFFFQKLANIGLCFDEKMSVFHSFFNTNLSGKSDYCQTGRLSGRIFLIIYYN